MMCPLKKLLSLLLVSAVLNCTAAELQTVLSHKVLPVGYTGQISLISDTGNYPEVRMVPRIRNLQWEVTLRRSESIRSSIFSVPTRENITSISFFVEKPGKYTIPPFEVKVGGKKLKTPALSFEAVSGRSAVQHRNSTYRDTEPERGEETDLSSLLFAKMNIGDGRRKVFYAGESVPLVIHSFFASGIQCTPSYPEIRLPANAVLQNTGKANPRNPLFEPPEQTRVQVDGKVYELITFRTALRSFVPGKLPVSMEMPVEVTVRNSSPRRRHISDPFGIFDDDDDDLFGMASSFFGGRRVRHTIRAKLSDLEIRPLPENRTGSFYTGLIGDWKTQISLSAPEGPAGSAVTLRIVFAGQGDSSMLKTPVPDVPGFRTYPAETDRKNGCVEVRYILIPLEKGVYPVSLRISTFNPVSGQYEVTSFKKSFTVSEAGKLMGNIPESHVVDSASEPEKKTALPEQKKMRGTDVLYLKKAPFHTLSIPLWRNSLPLQILLIAAGLLFFSVCRFIFHRKKVRENDPDYRRKLAARKNRSRLIADLKHASAEDSGKLSDRILAYVNDISGLPAGTTLDEAASAMEKRDPELAEGLRALTVNSWAPGTVSLSEEMKKVLLRGLARLTVLLLCFLPCTVFSTDDSGKAMNAYDTGKNEEALHCYQLMEKPGTLSPEIRYNMGNCLFRQGKYAAASAEYETALRLAPRDRDILENLNLAKRKLRLAEKRRMEQPSDVPPAIRDLCRPDEWLTVCAFGIMLLLAAGGLRGFTGKYTAVSVLTAGMFLILVSLAMILWQNNTSYAPDMAIVTGKSRSLFTLPSPDSPRLKELRLSPGEELSVIEKRPGWVRVRLGSSEGWIREEELHFLP